MRVFWLSLWILALAAAFALGRFGSGVVAPAPSPASSFQEVLDEDEPVARAFGISVYLRQLNAENVLVLSDSVAPIPPFWEDNVLLPIPFAEQLFMSHNDALAYISKWKTLLYAL